MPPPPHEIVTTSLFTSLLIVLASWISVGLGLGTTLRQPHYASSLKVAPDFISSSASSLVKNGILVLTDF